MDGPLANCCISKLLTAAAQRGSGSYVTEMRFEFRSNVSFRWA